MSNRIVSCIRAFKSEAELRAWHSAWHSGEGNLLGGFVVISNDDNETGNEVSKRNAYLWDGVGDFHSPDSAGWNASIADLLAVLEEKGEVTVEIYVGDGNR